MMLYDSSELKSSTRFSRTCQPKSGVTFISNDKSFRLADGQPNDGYLCKDGLHLNYRGTSRLIDNLRLAKLPPDARKPTGNNERQTNTSKRQRAPVLGAPVLGAPVLGAPVLGAQRHHDSDDNDRGNTTKNTINDGGDGDGDDVDEFSQPFWTRAKSKAGKGETAQHARNNHKNNNNKQRSRLSDHGNHRPADEERSRHGRDTSKRLYSQAMRSNMQCEFCAEPGHCTRECGFGDFAKCRQCGQQGHKQKFCHRYNTC